MRFTMTVEMDGAAFEEPASELARILREVASDVADGREPGSLRDVNGNRVGAWEIKG